MAHGWLAKLMPDAKIFSAGTQPKGVHPTAIEVMNEAGIDIADHTSDHVDRYAGESFDAVITVCDAAKEACPVFSGAKRTIHHPFDDPDGQPIGEFRRVRDEIHSWARSFAAQERDSA